MREYGVLQMTGAELKAYRIQSGFSQHKLAQLAGVHRCSVVYWEGKGVVDANGYAPKRFLDALNLKVNPTSNARARAWGNMFAKQKPLDQKIATELARLEVNVAKKREKSRVRCGAVTRKGRLCRLLSEAGRRRCKFHGGMSTGPKSQEGKERIASAQRKRWATWRADGHN